MLTNERLNNINKNLEKHLGLFSDAEMERNQKIYCKFRPRDIHDTKEAIEELLQLRDLRDMSDVDVCQAYGDVDNGIGMDPENPSNTRYIQTAKEALDKLYDMTIARGQTRTDAVNRAAEWAKECGRLDEEIERLKSKLEHKSQQVEAQVSLVTEMQAKIDYLTEENKRLHDEAQVADSLVLTLQEEVKVLTKERDEARSRGDYFRDGAAEWKEINRMAESERDEARKELAELRKAPGMEEIDALENEYLFTLKTLGHLGSLADRFSLRDIAVKLATLARQAIDSREAEKKRADEWQEKYEDENSERLIVEKERDEVVGLLKWIFRNQENQHHLDWAILSDESRRILEIVEGK